MEVRISHWIGCSLSRGFCIVLVVGMLAGCTRPTQNPPTAQASAAAADPAPAAPAEAEAKDERNRWAYDIGWFVQGNGKAWFEHNAEATRINGGPWEFTETSRTPEYVEIYDPRRGVSVRLAEPASQARWDQDGENAEWQTLYPGRWQKL